MNSFGRINFYKDSLISLTDWRHSAELKNYLNVLSFHELIQEAEETIKELNNSPLTKDAIQKAKMLLREYSLRLSHEPLNERPRELFSWP